MQAGNPAEKMEGVRKLAQMQQDNSDLALFDDYAQKFGDDNPMGMDFSEEISQMKQGWVEHRNDILKTFESRLKVDNFYFQEGVGGTDARQKELANKTLDVLDNLEKLTSKTSSLSPKKEVQLERPRVTERRAWDIQQLDNSAIEMSFTGSAKEARGVEAALKKFIDATPGLKEAMRQGMFDIQRDGGKVTFLITPRAAAPSAWRRWPSSSPTTPSCSTSTADKGRPPRLTPGRPSPTRTPLPPGAGAGGSAPR